MSKTLVGTYHRAEAIACFDVLLTYQRFSLCYLQRATHLARTHPPRLLADALRYFDVHTAAAVQQCLRLGALSHDTYVRATLPLRYGGLGIRSTCRVMHSAWVTSFGAVVQRKAFKDDPTLAPHAAGFIADAPLTLPCLRDWSTAVDTQGRNYKS